MTTYTELSASDKDPDSPTTTSLINALDENPKAQAEGDASVPNAFRIQPKALNDSVAGDALVSRVTKGTASTITSYTKKIEWLINRAGAYRVWLEGTASDSVNATLNLRVYKNGSAVGTERTATGGTSVTLSPVSEDFSGLVVGDLLQVYVKFTGSGSFSSGSAIAQLCTGDPVVAAEVVTVT